VTTASAPRDLITGLYDSVLSIWVFQTRTTISANAIQNVSITAIVTPLFRTGVTLKWANYLVPVGGDYTKIVASCDSSAQMEPEPHPFPNPNYTFAPPAGYSLVWNDEFDPYKGPTTTCSNGQPCQRPDQTKWAYEYKTLNDEKETYVNSTDNCFVQDGYLYIRGLNQSTSAKPEYYTSCFLNSLGATNPGSFAFGYWAAKLKVPTTKGAWPAFWLLGDSYYSQACPGCYWPTSGEIDILEAAHIPTMSYSTLHWNNASNGMTYVNAVAYGTAWETPHGEDLQSDDHVWWCEWTNTSLTVGIDQYTTFYADLTTAQFRSVWAFHGKWGFHTILNLAIGGGWPGNPDSTTVWPMEYRIDWVRYYKQTGSAATVSAAAK